MGIADKTEQVGGGGGVRTKGLRWRLWVDRKPRAPDANGNQTTFKCTLTIDEKQDHFFRPTLEDHFFFSDK